MSFKICISLIVIYTFSVYASDCDDKCCDKPHEHYSDCGTCEKTCRNFNVSFACAAVCMKGCFCDKGFVRNHEGDCVRIKDCFKCNGANEFFDCGSACDTECATLGQPCPIVNIKCNDMCYCKPGFARNNRNICVPVKDCPAHPKSCGINEVRDCLCLPRTTCKDPCKQPLYCPLGPTGGCIKECICKPGFVRNTIGQCVHASQCTPLDEDDCCDDEEFHTCGTFCPESCIDKGKSVPCSKQCVQGCFCKKGLIRDDNGRCVRRKDCDCDCDCDEKKKCPKHEEYKVCVKPCQATCDYRFPYCEKPCVNGCFCIDGYVRKTPGGPCIKVENCPKSPCNGDKNAEWVKQPYPCWATCQHNYVPSPTACKKKQKPWDCRCKQGYVINEITNKCVKYANCPP